VLFSLSVRIMCCSQVEQDVLRQDAAVLRYASSVIRTERAQQSTQFPGIARDVLTRLQLTSGVSSLQTRNVLYPASLPPCYTLEHAGTQHISSGAGVETQSTWPINLTLPQPVFLLVRLNHHVRICTACEPVCTFRLSQPIVAADAPPCVFLHIYLK
jgi:hypothetical protein